MKRYRDCGFIEKTIRWWKYIPLSRLVATLYVCIWILEGCKVLVSDETNEPEGSRWNAACAIWTVIIARYEVMMCRQPTLEEIRSALYAASSKEAK